MLCSDGQPATAPTAQHAPGGQRRQHAPRREESHAGRNEDVERNGSVSVSGVGPGGKAGDNVELSEEAADDLVGVSFGAEAIELRHHLGERFFDIGDGAVRVVLTLLFEAAFALCKFFAVEVGD